MKPGELRVRVTPRAGRNSVDVQAGKVCVRVTAPPADGQANEAVCRIVAAALGVPPSSVSVIRGNRGREKMLAIEGLDSQSAFERLENA